MLAPEALKMVGLVQWRRNEFGMRFCDGQYFGKCLVYSSSATGVLFALWSRCHWSVSERPGARAPTVKSGPSTKAADQLTKVAQ